MAPVTPLCTIEPRKPNIAWRHKWSSWCYWSLHTSSWQVLRIGAQEPYSFQSLGWDDVGMCYPIVSLGPPIPVDWSVVDG